MTTCHGRTQWHASAARLRHLSRTQRGVRDAEENVLHVPQMAVRALKVQNETDNQSLFPRHAWDWEGYINPPGVFSPPCKQHVCALGRRVCGTAARLAARSLRQDLQQLLFPNRVQPDDHAVIRVFFSSSTHASAACAPQCAPHWGVKALPERPGAGVCARAAGPTGTPV